MYVHIEQVRCPILEMIICTAFCEKCAVKDCEEKTIEE
jgi:hypothetical protein